MLGRISRAASSTVATTATGKRASQQTLVVPIGTTTAVRNRFKFAHLPPQFRQKMRAEHEMPGYVPTLMQFLRSQSKAPQNPMKPQKKVRLLVNVEFLSGDWSGYAQFYCVRSAGRPHLGWAGFEILSFSTMVPAVGLPSTRTRYLPYLLPILYHIFKTLSQNNTF